MEPFEFKVDTSTPYIKIISGLGCVSLGLALGTLISDLKAGTPIDWMHMIAFFLCSVSLIFLPYNFDRNKITLDEKGISYNDFSRGGEKNKEITWDKISEIRIDRNQIHIKRTIGSYEKIKFPLYTKKQIQNLKSYLQNIALTKEVTYLG